MVNQALLVIDVQTGFINGKFQVFKAETMLNRIKAIIEKARLARIPIIYVQHNEDLANDGPIHPSIAPQTGEPIILKMTPDAFHETNLKQVLDAIDVSHLVIAGFQTDYCINATSEQAYNLGYDVTIVKDAHSTCDTDTENAESIINKYNEKFSRFSNLINSDSLSFQIQSNKLITNTLIEELNLIFDMFEEAIQKIPITHWASGEFDYLIPARLIFHAIEAADYYTPDNPAGYIWKNRYDIDPEVGEIPKEKLPSQQQMLKYHNEVRNKIKDWFSNLSIDELIGSEEKFPWTGSTLLGRIMYVLAHYRQHFGELNAELRRRDIPRIKWRTYKTI